MHKTVKAWHVKVPARSEKGSLVLVHYTEADVYRVLLVDNRVLKVRDALLDENTRETFIVTL